MPRKTLDTPEQIVIKAAELVSTDGARGLTLAKLASALGVTKSAVLYHFHSKSSVLEAVSQFLVGRCKDRMQRLRNECGGAPENCCHGIIKMASDPEAQRSFRALVALRTEAPEESAAIVKHFRQITEELQHEGVPEVMAWIVRLAAEGLWMHRALRLPLPSKVIEKSIITQLGTMSEFLPVQSAKKKNQPAARKLRPKARSLGARLILGVVLCSALTRCAGKLRPSEAPEVAWKSPTEMSELRPEGISIPQSENALADSAATPRPNAETTGEATAADISAGGAPEESVQKLTLSDAVHFALKNSPRTRAAWLAAIRADQQHSVQLSEFYPVISGQYGLQNSRNDFAGNPVIIERTSSAPSLALTYTLFDLGERTSKARSAVEQLRAADFQHNRAIQEVTFAAQQSFFQYLAAQERVHAAEDSLKDAQQDNSVTSRSVEIGAKPQYEGLQSAARLREAEYMLEVARSGVESARASLAEALGIRVSEKLQVEAPNYSAITIDSLDTVTDRIEAALHRRPDLVAAYATVRAREADVSAIAGAALPKVVTSMNTSTTDIHGSSDSERNYQVVVALQVPIFSGFRDYNAFERARTDKKIALEDAKAREISVASEVWSTFHSVRSAQRQLQAAESLFKAEDSALKALRRSYEAGANPLLDVLQSQSRLALARYTLVNARASFCVELARLALDSGELPELPSVTPSTVSGVTQP